MDGSRVRGRRLRPHGPIRLRRSRTARPPTRRAHSMRKIAVLAATVMLAVPGGADARQKFRTVKSSGTIFGHLAQPATSEGYAFAGFVSDSKLGEGATTSQGTFTGSTPTGRLTGF